MIKAQRDIKRKLRVLNHAKETGNVSKTCRYFGISREAFYQSKRAYEKYGEKAGAGLPCFVLSRGGRASSAASLS
jgi:hypothetical protein